MAGELGCDVFLRGITMPGSFDDAGAQIRRNFYGAIVRAAIEHQNLIAAAQAFDDARYIAFLVERNDRRGNFHGRLLDLEGHDRDGNHKQEQGSNADRDARCSEGTLIIDECVPPDQKHDNCADPPRPVPI